MWPPFCLPPARHPTRLSVTTRRPSAPESARHNFTMWALSCLFLMKNMFNVTTVLPNSLLQTSPCIRHNFSTQVFRKRMAQLHYVGSGLHFLASIFWPPFVVPCAFWRLVSKCCGECKGSFARSCEAKLWSHWTCSSLGTIFQPMRINPVPDVKCFVIIKMCYVHNQWYDISCVTLYVASNCMMDKTFKRICEEIFVA
jgi:hypothetical protein